MAPTGKHLGALVPAILLAFAGACTGPSTRVEDPGHHRVFVDGERVEPAGDATTTELPFHYYGGQQVTVLPADGPRRANFDVQAQRFVVVTPPPVPRWCFPFDFPAEIAMWLANGTAPTAIPIDPPATPPEQRAAVDYRPTGLEQVGARARAARLVR